jgi:hypothetical protein
MKPCRTKYKKAINKYKYDRVAHSPLSKHCYLKVSGYDHVLGGWLIGRYLFVVVPKLKRQLIAGQEYAVLQYTGLDYFRYYVGDNIRKDHVMFYETGLECKF